MSRNPSTPEGKVQSLVAARQRLQQRHAVELATINDELFLLLYKLRGELPVTQMAELTGRSRNWIYAQWRRLGYEV